MDEREREKKEFSKQENPPFLWWKNVERGRERNPAPNAQAPTSHWRTYKHVHSEHPFSPVRRHRTIRLCRQTSPKNWRHSLSSHFLRCPLVLPATSGQKVSDAGLEICTSTSTIIFSYKPFQTN
ncbi:hypothetical protein CDAR_55381 [Caerostris darwini]|uniref:Uncharacterized protein n=1 Tax=Caerostris darwini TaxID=1538125 RepID=A0AAV4U1W2_9ARAC|nr:hypothetical protein CDAR_55381 [Caerostris darwini]